MSTKKKSTTKSEIKDNTDTNTPSSDFGGNQSNITNTTVNGNYTHNNHNITYSTGKPAQALRVIDGKLTIQPMFYNVSNIITSTILEPKFKLERGKFTEFKQNLMNYSYKLGIWKYIDQPTTTTWKHTAALYPGAVNGGSIYRKYREEMAKIFGILIDTVRDAFTNLESLSIQLKEEYFKEKDEEYSESKLTYDRTKYQDELDVESDLLETYTGDYWDTNPHLLWKYIKKTYEPIQDSAFSFIGVMHELISIRFNPSSETANNFIQRFNNIITKLNRILLYENPKPGQLLTQTIISALLLHALPYSHRTFDAVLFEKKHIEPEVIIQQLLKREEVDRNSGRGRPTQRTNDDSAYFNNNSAGGNRRFDQNRRGVNQNFSHTNRNFSGGNQPKFNHSNNSRNMLTLYSAGDSWGPPTEDEPLNEQAYSTGEGGETYENFGGTGDDDFSAEGVTNNELVLCATDDLDASILEAVGITPDEYALAVRHTRETRDNTLNLNEIKPFTVILDSASTKHICYNKALLTNLRKLEVTGPITGLGGNKLTPTGVGDLYITKTIRLTNVYLVPNAGVNLISVPALSSKGCGVWFDDYSAIVYDRMRKDPERTILKFEKRGNLYMMLLTEPKAVTKVQGPSGFEYIKPNTNQASNSSPNTRSQVTTPITRTSTPQVRRIPRKINTGNQNSFTPNRTSAASTDARAQLLAARNANRTNSNSSTQGGAISGSSGSGGTVSGNGVTTSGNGGTVSGSANYVDFSYYDECYVATDGIELEEVNEKQQLYDLHCQIGHQKLTRDIISEAGINYTGTLDIDCSVCNKTKLTRADTGRGNFDRPDEKFSRLHVDLIGPISTYDLGSKSKVPLPTVAGANYILTMIDYYTSYAYVVPIKSKADAAQHVIGTINQIRNQFGVNVKTLFSDGGTEFINSTIKDYCYNQGIKHLYGPADTPNLNGKNERFNRQLLTIIRALILEVGANKNLWGEAAIAATIIHNYTPKKLLNGHSPYELATGRKPDISKLVKFGQDVEVLLTTQPTGKFDAKSITATVLYYNTDRLSYRIMLPDYRIIHSRDIKLLNTSNMVKTIGTVTHPNFTVTHPMSTTTTTVTPSIINNSNTNALVVPLEVQSSAANAGNSAVTSSTSGGDFINLDSDDEGVNDSSDQVTDTSGTLVEDTSDTQLEETNSDAVEALADELDNITIKQEENTASENWSDSINLPIVPLQPLDDTIQYSSRGRLITPAQQFNIGTTTGQSYAALESRVATTVNEIESGCVSNSSSIIDESDPISMKQIENSPNKELWLKSMQDEIKSLVDNNVVQLVERPKNKKLIKTKWVWKLKRDHHNKPMKIKSRIVAKGYSQQPGLDFDAADIYSPVVRFKTIKTLLSLAARFGLVLQQLDFSTAFLNGTLTEDLYISVPKELNDGTIDPAKYCFKLNKSLYGLRQSPVIWNRLLASTLVDLGYTAIENDQCVFIKRVEGHTIPIIISCYVDDLIIYSLPALKEIWLKDKEIIRSKFKIDDIGDLDYVLKMKVSTLPNGDIKLDQTGYIISLLERFGMTKCSGTDNPVMTLELTEPSLFKDDDTKLDEQSHELYRQMIGSLLYLSNTTRLDITFAVNQLARFVSHPTKRHLVAVKNIFRYLTVTADYGLLFKANTATTGTSVIKLEVFSDADWASDKLTRSSTTGFVVMVDGNPVHWGSLRQRGISQSSTEAEYISVNVSAREAVWFHRLLVEIFSSVTGVNGVNGVTVTVPTIRVDNQACMHWITGPDVDHNKTKHIDLRYKYIRWLYGEKLVDIAWCPTKQMLADCLTKRIATNQFQYLVSKLLYVSSR